MNRSSSSALTSLGGVDMPDLSNSEAMLVAFDLGAVNSGTPDGTFDIVVGVPLESTSVTPSGCTNFDVSCFGVYRYDNSAQSISTAPELTAGDALVTDAPNGDWHNWATVRQTKQQQQQQQQQQYCIF